MSSVDDETERVGKLIERLLVDPAFRARFRSDPSAACVETGLPELAAELGGSGKAMHTLEMRESRSSLAGVVMAIATEGVALEEMQHLAGHLHDLPGLGKLLHGVKLPRGLQKLERNASPAAMERRLERKAGVSGTSVKRLHEAARVAEPGHPTDAPAGAGGTAATSAPAGGSAAGATTPPAGGTAAAATTPEAGGATAAAATAPTGTGAGTSGVEAASSVPTGGTGAGTSGVEAASSVPTGGTGAGTSGVEAASSVPTGGTGAGTSGVEAASSVPTGGTGAGTSGVEAASSVPTGGTGAGTSGVEAASSVPTGGSADVVSAAPSSGSGVVSNAIEQSSSAGGSSAAAGVPAVEQLSQGGSGGGAVDSVSSAGAGLSGLLDSPNLTASPGVREWLASGGVDPRMLSVLDSTVGHFSIGVANVELMSSPVHVQSLDIVSVDGQPVGPDNFAARELVAEIAGMDSGVRPDEIGTPWPIQSPGFFSDASSTGSVHLAFEMPGTNASAAEAAGYSSGAEPSGADGYSNAADSASAPQSMNYAIGAQPASAPGTPLEAAAGAQSPATPVAEIPTSGAAQEQAIPPTAGGQPAIGDSAGSASESAGGAVDVGNLPSATSIASDPSYGSPTAHAAFEAAKGELGEPYRYGDESPQSGFDCSGLTQWAYHQAGVDIPRVAADQFNVGTPVSLSDLKEGDLVFFRISGGAVDHVGMYVGNNEFIEAPATGQNVQYASLNDPYWAQRFAGARQIVPLAAPPATPDAAVAPAGATPVVTTPDAAVAPAGATPVVTTPDAAVAPAGATPVVTTPDAAVAPGGATPVVTTPGASELSVGPNEQMAGSGFAVAERTAAVSGAQAPGTAALKAVPLGPASQRHTVQFLQAVRPAPGSQLASQADGAAPPAGQVPVDQINSGTEASGIGQSEGASPVVEPVGTSPQVVEPVGTSPQVVEPVGTSPQVVEPGSPSMSEQVGGQAAEVLPVDGMISVSSPELTSGQEIFAAHLAQLTGLSPRVIAAWELAEESGPAAQARQGASNFNWLNIGYFDSGPGQIAFNDAFSDPVTAAEQTARFLKGTWGGASESIRAILSSAGQASQHQISAIANSDWASTHYYGGSSLRGTYDELGDMKVEIVNSGGAGGASGQPQFGFSSEAPQAPAAEYQAVEPSSGSQAVEQAVVYRAVSPATPNDVGQYPGAQYEAGQYQAVAPAGQYQAVTPAVQSQAEYPVALDPAAGAPGSAGQVEQLASAGAEAQPGLSISPDAIEKLNAMVKEADSILGKPYIFGGGHDGWGPQQGYDCSGFVSAVLHAGGFLKEPCVTSDLPGQPGILNGPGKIVTIYDRADPTGGQEGHVIICINGQFYESGGEHGAWGGGGGVEKIGRPSDAYLATFGNVLHPEGF